jgi:hypothetical protein
MSIKCGHCHERHETVAQVRNCASAKTAPTVREEIARRSAYDTRGTKVTEAGMYLHRGTAYKVVQSKETGNLYAKALIKALGDDGKYAWQYARGAMAYLKAEDKMTREQAQAYGHQTGVCAKCGAELTHPVSVERGMGPICYGRWYDEN